MSLTLCGEFTFSFGLMEEGDILESSAGRRWVLENIEGSLMWRPPYPRFRLCPLNPEYLHQQNYAEKIILR